MRHPTTRPSVVPVQRTLLACMIAVGLAACGGGGDDAPAPPVAGGGGTTPTTPTTPVTPTPPAPPAPVRLTGTVAVDGLVRNAVVCLDLNNNAACDTGEPASARTGATGAYELSYDPATVTAAQVAASSLIAAMVPGALTDANTTIDAADTTVGNTARRYVLRQVPGKAGQINPLTTLVAAGMAAGMTEATARANAATQLGISAAKIDNYQDDPAFSSASFSLNARLAAKITAAALEDGAQLAVADPTVAQTVAPNDLRLLNYTDAGNWRVLEFVTQARAAGQSVNTVTDQRAGRAGNAALGQTDLFTQAMLTSAGWQRCDATVPIQARLGTPSLSTFCGVRDSIGYRRSVDVAGRTMASVVTEQQGQAGDIFNNFIGGSDTAMLAALGNATFPAGSSARPGISLNLNQPLFITNTNTDLVARNVATTLEQLVAARPTSGVNLANASGTLSLGLSTSALRNLRVAFSGTTSPTAGTVQFYDCDLNEAQTLATNCTATQTGTYEIVTINGTRVMRFAGNAPTTGSRELNGYAEVRVANLVSQANPVATADTVYRVRWQKPDIDSNLTQDTRLNATAGAAMRSQLGL